MDLREDISVVPQQMHLYSLKSSGGCNALVLRALLSKYYEASKKEKKDYKKEEIYGFFI